MQPPALAPTIGRVLQDPIGYLITDVVLRNASPMSFDVMLLDPQTAPSSEQIYAGGHLWWRRWSEPDEQVHGYIEFTNGGFDDFVADAETLAEEIGDWQRGRFPYRGEVLRVSWLDDDASRRLWVTFLGRDDVPHA
jgi:hypothetical protein